MAGEPGKKGEKRVSFLMPYIDFCFMLIIIFIGMLSIAYFEPLGAMMETKNDPIITDTAGPNTKKPVGIQQANIGLGEDTPDEGKLTPLVKPTESGSQQQQAQVDPKELERLKNELKKKEQELARLKKLEQELKDKEDELKRLKEMEEQMQQLRMELARLRDSQGQQEAGPLQIDIPGKGNHVYLDLRNKDKE